jgi:2,3-bisphosphoglycerate-dependent phosphoglycerate mutase
MIEILVMRHGQSVADVEGRFEGNADFPLTELGRKQARLLANWIAANYPPEKIISSPLRRAAETAEILGSRANVAIDYDDNLKEINIGIWAGMKREEALKRFPFPAGGFKPHDRVPSGESGIEVRARAEIFWSKFISEIKSDAHVAIVSHGSMINMLFRSFLNLPVASNVNIKTSDTGIHLLNLDRDKDTRSIIFLNRCDHLITDERNG